MRSSTARVRALCDPGSAAYEDGADQESGLSAAALGADASGHVAQAFRPAGAAGAGLKPCATGDADGALAVDSGADLSAVAPAADPGAEAEAAAGATAALTAGAAD